MKPISTEAHLDSNRRTQINGRCLGVLRLDVNCLILYLVHSTYNRSSVLQKEREKERQAFVETMLWCCAALEPLGPEEEENAEIHEIAPKRRTTLDGGDHSVKSHLSPSAFLAKRPVPLVTTSEQIVSGALVSFLWVCSGWSPAY
jgi:hypothetical protein